MQIAQDRVHLLPSFADMRSHAGACSQALYLHKPLVRKGLLFAASSTLSFLAFKMFQRKKKGDVAIPWLRKCLGIAAPEKKRKRGFLKRLFLPAE